MTPEQQARAALAQGQNFDGLASGPRMVVNQPSSLPIRITVPIGGLTEVPFLSVGQVDQVGDDVSFITIPDAAEYQTLLLYLLSNPCVVGNFQASTATAAVMAGLKIAPRTKNPFGSVAANPIACQSYKTAGDFVGTLVNVPISFLLDGFNDLLLTSVDDAGAATIIDFTFFVTGRQTISSGMVIGQPLSVGPNSPFAQQGGGLMQRGPMNNGL